MFSAVVNKLLQYSTEVCGLKSAIFACVTNYIGVERKENQEITVPRSFTGNYPVALQEEDWYIFSVFKKHVCDKFVVTASPNKD